MSKFKVGDLVKCVNYDDVTGERLLQYGRDAILTVTGVYRSSDITFILVNGGRQEDHDGAYSTRFVLSDQMDAIVLSDQMDAIVLSDQMDAIEYEETMAFEKLVNG